jgi:hypothetical protein
MHALARRLMAVLAAVSLVGVALPPSVAHATDPTRQNGDLFVGAAGFMDGYGNTSGAIFRVRGTTAIPFCVSPVSSFDPGFWNIPYSVIVDSHGRIVFLSVLGDGNVGLLRCDAQDAPAEQLAALRVRGPVRTGWPEPFPELRFGVRIGSLHVLKQRVITEDFQGAPKLNNNDSYELVAQLQSAPGDPTVPGPAELFSYDSVTQEWRHGRDLPEVLPAGNLVSVIAHGDSLWMLNSGTIRQTSLPLQLGLMGTAGGVDFKLSLGLFGGVHELDSATVDNLDVPNVPSGCDDPNRFQPPHSGPPSLDMPAQNGGLIPFSADSISYDEQGSLGLVVKTGYGPMPGPYLTQVSSALLNDNPQDDLDGYYHQGWDNCRHVPWIQFRPILPYTAKDGSSNSANVIATAPGGMVGTSFWGNKVVRLTPGDRVTDIATLIEPMGIAAYPAVVPSLGTVVYFTIHSPVDVLVTDASGRRIGVDPVTGAPVNDFGAKGFDSGAGEPRVLAIYDPAPGAFQLQAIGTGTGPYTIDVSSADLVGGATARIRATGTAAPGVSTDHDFSLSADSTLAFATTTPVDTTPPTMTPQVIGTSGTNGWYVSDVSVSWTVADDGSPISSTSGCGPVTITADSTTPLTCSATSAGGTTTTSVTVKRDVTPPSIAGAPDRLPNANGWYRAPVTVHFTCADATSGVASCPADTTLGADGQGQTVQGTATDQAGNTASASVDGINIDQTPPTVHPVVSPEPVLLNGIAAVTAGASDTLSGIETSSCGALDTSTVGTHAVICAATDRAGNSASGSAIYRVTYAICPLYDPTMAAKSGSTVPIKIQLCDASGANVSASGIAVHATTVTLAGTAIGSTAVAAGNANPGNFFRYDEQLKGYIFNLKTTGLATGGWQLNFEIGVDPVAHSARIDIR